MPYKVEYEILYKYSDSNGEFVSHASGRPDVRSDYGETIDDACSREWFENDGRNKVVVHSSEEISQEEYDQWLRGQEYKYECISRNHRNGVE